MNKRFWLKLCVLVLAISMVVSLAACNGGKIEDTTEAPKQQTTEAPEKNTTEAPGKNTTETPDNNTTETSEGNKIPEADSTLTIDQAVELGLSMGHDTYTEGKYYVIGIIRNVYNTTYGNMVLVDEDGNEFTIYGSYSADGETRYDALDVKPVDGDTVKVYGIIGQYNGTAQIKNGWIVEHTPATPTTTEAPTTESTEAPTTETTEAPTTETTEAPMTETTEAPTTETAEATTTETTEVDTTETAEDPECDHVPGDEWKYDGEKHWKECQCGQKHNESIHEPDGIQANAEGHWNPCVCGKKLNESAHDDSVEWENDRDEHWKTCVCTWPLVSGVHTPETVPTEDGTKHFVQCSECKKVLGEPTDHSFACEESGVSHKCVCGATEECGADEIEFDANGHWTVGCTVCEISIGESAAHANPKMSTDTDDGVTYTYTYKCTCGYVLETRTVTMSSEDNGLNYYVTAWNKIGFNAWNTGEKYNSGEAVGKLMYDDVSGVIFSRVSLQDGGSFELVSTSDEQITNGMITPEGTLFGGSGNYLVIKVRFGSAEQELGIYANDGTTANTPDGKNWTFGCRRTGLDADEVYQGWRVYVIDTANLMANFYTKGSTTATKITIGFMGDGTGGEYSDYANKVWKEDRPFDENDYIDISYVALCDNLTEVDSVIGNDSVVFTNWDNLSQDVVMSSSEFDSYVSLVNDPEHADCDHNYGVTYVKDTTDANKLNVVCTLCAATVKSFTVGAAEGGINFFAYPDSARFAMNIYNAGGKGNANNWFGGIFYDVTNGIQFTRIKFAESGQAEFLNHLHGYEGGQVPNGQTPTQTAYGRGSYFVIKMRTSSPTSTIKFAALDGVNGTTTIKGNTWVFNMNARNTFEMGWHTYVIDLARYDDCGSYRDSLTKAMYAIMGGADGEFVDIAYFAVCDNWTEVQSVVTEDTVIFAKWSAPQEDVVINVDGTCIEHEYVHAQNGEYKCYVCGAVDTTESFTVDANGVNYFVTVDNANNGWIGYNRYNVDNRGSTKRAIGNKNYIAADNTTYMRFNCQTSGQFELVSNYSVANGNNAPTQTVYGSGNYVVIKMRAATGTNVQFAATTSDKSYEEWQLGTNSITTTTDGWVVYVIDLNNFNDCGKYTKNSASITKAMYTMRASDVSVDIAYLAVCDTWAEIDSVVLDDTVTLACSLNAVDEPVVNVADMVAAEANPAE